MIFIIVLIDKNKRNDITKVMLFTLIFILRNKIKNYDHSSPNVLQIHILHKCT